MCTLPLIHTDAREVMNHKPQHTSDICRFDKRGTMRETFITEDKVRKIALVTNSLSLYQEVTIVEKHTLELSILALFIHEVQLNTHANISLGAPIPCSEISQRR